MLKPLSINILEITGPVPAPKSSPLDFLVKSLIMAEVIGATNF